MLDKTTASLLTDSSNPEFWQNSTRGEKKTYRKVVSKFTREY